MSRSLQLSLSVNGEAVELSCAGYKTLLEVLREDLGLTGTKHGCELGDLGAAQCGYCTPGILMTAKALLDKETMPGRERIKEAISGNLCRCTGYQQIFEAIEEAARRLEHESHR